MIQAIKELGEYKLKREGRDTSDILSILTQDPNQTNRYPFVFVVVFNLKEGNKVSYSHILLEETDKEKSKKYLYRRASSQGPNYTPTCITGGDFKKTLRNRIEGWFNKIKKAEKERTTIFELKTDEETVKIPVAPILENLFEAFKENRIRIFEELTQKWNEVRPSLKEKAGTGVVLTIGFVGADSSIKYIGEFPEFKNFLLNCKISKLRGIYKEKHTCSICQKYTGVYGNAIADIFKFYVLDKPGYIAGGFQKLNAWKNFPLCLDCTLKIEEGKDFLDSYLQFSMGKNKYYLVPKFILGIEEAKEVISGFFEGLFKTVTRSKDTLTEIKHISEDEKEILEELGKYEDLITYNFIFFERQKGSSAVHRINLLVEDVLPSRLSTIFEVKKKAEEQEIFKNIKYENVEFRFDIFREFVSSDDFLEVIDKIFRGITINRTLLFSWLMKTLRTYFIKEQYIKEQYLKPVVLRAFVCLNFFEKLGILEKNNYTIIKRGAIMTELKNEAEKFFQKFPEVFHSSAYKAVFLLGVLAQKLLDIQYSDRRTTPFRKNLKGLRMKEYDFKALLPKIQNKLEEYKKNHYRSLESLISTYFLEAGKDWKIATDELNFYFVLGMNLKEEVDGALNLVKKEE